MLRRVIMLLALACGFPGPAAACTYLDWNPWSALVVPSLTRLVREAETIDWVNVRHTGPQLCPQMPDPRIQPAAYAAVIADGSEALLATDCFTTDPKPGMLAASVVERLKGSSEQTFDLFFGFGDGTDMKFGFADIRELPITDAYRFELYERIEADNRHASTAFWHESAIGWSLDGMDSCGGRPALSPAVRYIVMRDAAGAVTASVPVKHEDDALLARLRLKRDQPDSDLRPSLAVADYFRNTDDLALIRVMRCRTVGVTGSLSQSNYEPGAIAVERGTHDAANDLDELWSFFDLKGKRCPAGGQVLIASFVPDGVGQQPYRRSPVDILISGAFKMFGDEEFDLFGAPFVGRPLAQPLVVQDGKVHIADILTGLRLEGPESVSVDDAFRWHEEGRTARTSR
jgi:hypothetical protein